jgi:hypothetical protein
VVGAAGLAKGEEQAGTGGGGAGEARPEQVPAARPGGVEHRAGRASSATGPASCSIGRARLGLQAGNRGRAVVERRTVASTTACGAGFARLNDGRGRRGVDDRFGYAGTGRRDAR